MIRLSVRRAPGAGGGSRSGGLAGFTLLEVMIAMALFFLAIFAILDATNQSLRAARALQSSTPDATSLVADLMLTNRIEEGVESGDFGELYPGFQWSRQIFERETNGLYQVDFTITGRLAGNPYVATNSLLLWRPESSQVLPGRRRAR